MLMLKWFMILNLSLSHSRVCHPLNFSSLFYRPCLPGELKNMYFFLVKQTMDASQDSGKSLSHSGRNVCCSVNPMNQTDCSQRFLWLEIFGREIIVTIKCCQIKAIMSYSHIDHPSCDCTFLKNILLTTTILVLLQKCFFSSSQWVLL